MKKARPIWQRRAVELGGLLPLGSLDQSAVAAITSRSEKERIAIACSGGADSLALVLLLWAHFPERRGRWLILHFNHKLRGRSSDSDARFVATIARGLGEKSVTGSWKHGKQRSGIVPEAEARIARHEFFAREMRKVRSRAIVFGHQRDDIAETMIMRLSRGSGTGGLAAPRPVQAGAGDVLRVRPLLTVSRSELRQALQTVGAGWREDASNETDNHYRNRVRRNVLPALQKASPQKIDSGFAASRAQLDEDDDALEHCVTVEVGQPVKGSCFDLHGLRSQPRALVRRAVHRWLVTEDLVDVLSRAAVAGLIDAVRFGDDLRLSVGGRRFIRTRRSCLWIELRKAETIGDVGWPSVVLRPGETILGPAGDRLVAKEVRLTAALRKRILSGEWSPTEVVHVDPGPNWVGEFVVRSWKAGDRYRPLGSPGRSSLQDLFVNRKIPRELRKCLPVICRTDLSPLWVPGLPPSADVSLQPASKLVVQLTYAPAVAKLNRLTSQNL